MIYKELQALSLSFFLPFLANDGLVVIFWVREQRVGRSLSRIFWWVIFYT